MAQGAPYAVAALLGLVVWLLRDAFPVGGADEIRKHLVVVLVLFFVGLLVWATHRISTTLLEAHGELEDQILEWRNRFWDLGDEKPPREQELWQRLDTVGAAGGDLLGLSVPLLWLVTTVLLLSYC